MASCLAIVYLAYTLYAYMQWPISCVSKSDTQIVCFKIPAEEVDK